MSVLYFSCECGSAEPLLRKLLQEAGCADWLSAPLHKGREHCLHILEQFPASFKSLTAYQALVKQINEHSSYVCVVGYDNETFYWADIAKNAPKDRVEATAILKRFA